MIIRRFKSIRELEVQIPQTDTRRQGSADFVSILGENNAGKSSILEAIRLAFPGGSKPTIDHFPFHDVSKGPIEVELEFNQLNEKDKAEHAIRVHVFSEGGDDKYRIKKEWTAPNAPPTISAYHPYPELEFDLLDWPDSGGLGKRGLAALSPDWQKLMEATKGKPTKEACIQAARAINSPLLIERKGDHWRPRPGGVTPTVDTALPKVIFVPALQPTGDEANVSEKQSAVRKIVSALFEQQLSRHEKVIRFRRAAAELEDLFLADGKHRIVSHVEDRIASKLRELIDIDADLRFKSPDVTADLTGKTEFRVVDGELSTRPEHQGHGAQRSIVLALLQLYAEMQREGQENESSMSLFLIEEPEIYMHPEMCRRMRDTLLRIAQDGRGQVICTTHSPVFVDLADRHDGIVIVKKEEGSRLAVATQRSDDVFAADRSGPERRDRLRMMLNFDASANEVFFSKRVCLVEGDSEVAAIDAIARKLDAAGEIDRVAYLAARRSVAMINCRGKWTIPAFQTVLNAFGIEYRVVHDQDRDEAAEANVTIQSLCPLGNTLVHVPNFEGDVFGASWTDDKPWRTTRAVERASAVNDKLRRFFEFVLHCRIVDLRTPKSEFQDPASVRLATSPPSKRNLRNRLADAVGFDDGQSVPRLEHFFRKAVLSRSRVGTPDKPSVAPQDDSPATQVFVSVSGDSMADTLTDGDVVALEILDGVWLDPVVDGRKLTSGAFRGRVQHDAIYVVAVNEQIVDRTYSLRRVRVHDLMDGGWLCQISTDNPDASWGERGHFEVRRTDRVHFAARVIGIVPKEEQAVPSGELSIRTTGGLSTRVGVPFEQASSSAQGQMNATPDRGGAFQAGGRASVPATAEPGRNDRGVPDTPSPSTRPRPQRGKQQRPAETGEGSGAAEPAGHQGQLPLPWR